MMATMVKPKLLLLDEHTAALDPKTAAKVLEITDKITVMNLRSFIVGEERRHRYHCEFPSIELFLGVIMSTGAEIRIISPDWLREKLIDFANRILICNKEQEE